MMMLFLVVVLALTLTFSNAIMKPFSPSVYGRSNTEKRSTIAAILPGDPIITGGLAQGAVTAVSLYSKVILARYGELTRKVVPSSPLLDH